MLCSLVVQEDLELEQLDVKTAFLHGDLTEDIYTNQPQEYIEKDKENQVCYLKKSIYGLKQSPRCWYKRFDDFISKLGFNKISYDSCAFINSNYYSSKVYLLLYVDDMQLAGKSKFDIKRVKTTLKEEFDTKKLGESKRILGIDVTKERTKKLLTIDQSNYCYKVLKRFNMLDAKQVVIPLHNTSNY